jgi:hypothetical protein
MAAREFDKYFIYESPANPFHPPGSFPGTEMFVMNSHMVSGAPRLMCAWFAGPWTVEETYKPHAHNHDEVLMFLGSDYEKPRELGGEVEFWFKDELYSITRSCAIYVPQGVQHAPMRPTRVDDPSKPILFVGFVPSEAQDDLNYYSRASQWSRYKDPLPMEGPVLWLD